MVTAAGLEHGGLLDVLNAVNACIQSWYLCKEHNDSMSTSYSPGC